MDVRKIFIEITEYLTPYKQEDMLEPYLPNNIQKDEVGNYYIIIGETKTMFTSHLDNYCKKVGKVNHVFYEDGKYVKTDGKTVLGSDDKAGVVIMLNMIEHKVPGCYYFFIGEEPILSGGCKGSRSIFAKKPDWFKQFDRCIAFDRRGYGSIISRMNTGQCCSREFVEALASEFKSNDMEYKSDPGGYYTDSAVFMPVIPEVTNLSCGGFREHNTDEFQNLNYLERVANATVKINWEGLPVVRVPAKEKPVVKKQTGRLWGSSAVRATKTYKDFNVSSKPIPQTKDEIGAEIQRIKDKLSRKEQQKSKPNLGLFNYKSFVKKRGKELFEVVEDYMEYFGYKKTYINSSFNDKLVIGEFEKVRGLIAEPKPVLNNRGTPFALKDNISIKVEGEKIKMDGVTYTDINEFEKLKGIGFAAKFYKYVDEFIADLKEYSMNNKTFTIKRSAVEKILSKYGNYTISDLYGAYDDLFDDDDFKFKVIKSSGGFGGSNFDELGIQI